MTVFGFDAWQWLALFQLELLLFAGVFFLIGAADDLAIDLTWIWLKLTGRAKTREVDRAAMQAKKLHGSAAIFIPAWHEANVIGDTIRHALLSWPQKNLRLYVGCYRNDPATITAAMAAAQGDARFRIVIHDRSGPSTKADCLNRLHEAMRDDERRSGTRFSLAVFHDAEDLVDPAGLALLDQAIAKGADFAQLPVEALPQEQSRWLGSHYCEEFAEAHAKSMVVRDALGAALPAAGVGCAVSRKALSELSRGRVGAKPFREDSLTEDYELGLAVAQSGGTCRFVRARGSDGLLIATRAYFPAKLDEVVRQKTRWVHGIALQGWDRIGWGSSLIEVWMRARDRRGPMTAFLLLIGYTVLALTALGWAAIGLGYGEPVALSPVLKWLLIANFAAFLWRALSRFAFTAREYGVAEGLRALLRIPLTNIISIMAGRRAIFAYAKTLMGSAIVWDKTPHTTHPARMPPAGSGLQ
ncbi:glycosyl transferase family protein [Erythrobacter crassostreae]|uniref:Glycosyl transferase family protein n=1 Tax=Erythrobacter crassostreae TaxID=2828328 RepID=A0A9X1F374_9SPHN|nr:glycosyl transferase family protein [Erythrobacter crassostrea]MBV7259202.1 glycosyl transferase family protein [Erythrobacter crassostrea]